jgi:hypothetical protein
MDHRNAGGVVKMRHRFLGHGCCTPLIC